MYLSQTASVFGGALALATLWNVGEVIAPEPIYGAAVYADPVTAGEAILLPWSIDKRTDCPGYAGRVWEGQQDFSLSEPVQATSIPEGVGTYNIPTKIPGLAPAGEMKLWIKGHFDCPGAPPRYFTLGPVIFEVTE